MLGLSMLFGRIPCHQMQRYVVLAKPKIFDKDGKLNVVWKNSLLPNAQAVVFAQLMIFDKDGK